MKAKRIKALKETLGLEAPILQMEGLTFRDLNKNGKLDPYEDSRVPINERVENLLGQMTLEEKAGLMFQTIMGINKDGTLADKISLFNQIATTEMVVKRKMSHFNVMQLPPIKKMAEWVNRVQKLAERTRLGIPISVATDPRHAFTTNPGGSMFAGEFSLWPEQPGFAAIGDSEVMKEFGDIARQEYLAAGIRVALHPMADLATEPRWGRSNGTFGENAELSSKMIKAYILGFQGEKIGPESVSCMTKHFPGGGPQEDGEDAHFKYGKNQVYPGDNFDYHLIPFEAAFEAGTSQIMPYYGRPVGTSHEEIGFGFNKDVITGLLREKYGFEGIVCSDWMLLTGMKVAGKTMIVAKDWGVEHLSISEKAKKVIEAGVDQFGGEACPEVIVELVEAGMITEERIDESVRRLLREKFALGLFDNPYLDPEMTENIVGKPVFREAGKLAQKKSYVLLKNDVHNGSLTLPVSGKPKIYIEGISEETAGQYGEVVQKSDEADIAILRLSTPYEKRRGLLESFFHAGDLDFKGKEKKRILNIMETIPTIVDIYLERPAVIPEIAEKAAAVLANFGAEDDVALDVIFGEHVPNGKLPFELPSSMAAVRAQREDMPSDSEAPLYEFGFGLTYEK
ncbi:MAG: glycoside hydrolase family 3 protein [Anaerolineae bacterium]|nr:glycoside hydrolase family 3 protein [Anaerolineae bacterium]MBT7783700.1 glycoside hydrolase family 3 protein [Anaerolineae bacterium]